MSVLLPFALATLLHGNPAPAGVFVGRDNQLRVQIPRVTGDAAVVAIDGTLNEAVWQSVDDPGSEDGHDRKRILCHGCLLRRTRPNGAPAYAAGASLVTTS